MTGWTERSDKDVSVALCQMEWVTHMARFTLIGIASAQLPLRVLGLFAQRDIPVDGFVLSRNGDDCRIEVTVGALPVAAVGIVLEKLRALVEVISADAEEFAC